MSENPQNAENIDPLLSFGGCLDSPLVDLSSLANKFRSIDFPDPFGPTIATHVPMTTPTSKSCNVK